MPANYLYKFLKTCDNPKETHTDIKGNSYIMLGLSWKNKLPETLIIAESHLTIYEHYDKSHNCLTPVHYSAYFTHGNANEYRVHVYFDEKGNIVHGPLCDIKKNTTWSPCTTESIDPEGEIVDYFLSHADAVTRPILREIYQNIFSKLKALESDASEFERQYQTTPMTSVTEQKNLLNLWLKNLLSQRALYRDSSHIVHKIKQLNHIRTSLSVLEMTPLPSSQKEIEDNAYNVKTSRTSPQKSPQKTPSQELIIALSQKITQFQEPLSHDEALKILPDFMIWCLSIDEKLIKQLSLGQQVAFNQFFMQLEIAGAELLRRILFAQGPINNEALDKLAIFFDQIGQNDLVEAVKQKDIEKIEWVISRNELLINIPFEMEADKQKENLMSYCVQLVLEGVDLSFAQQCIEMLATKYNVSLVVRINEYLTFLEWIQLQPTHPIYPIIAKMSIWQNLSTYVALRDSMLSIDLTNLPEEEQNRIAMKIKSYTTIARMFSRSSSILKNDNLAKVNHTLSARLSQIGFSIEDMIKLGADREIIELELQTSEITSQLSQIIPSEFINLGFSLIPLLLDATASKLPDLSQKSYEEKREYMIADTRKFLLNQRQTLAMLTSMNSSLLMTGLETNGMFGGRSVGRRGRQLPAPSAQDAENNLPSCAQM